MRMGRLKRILSAQFHPELVVWGWLLLDWLVLKSKKAISERFVKIWARQLRGNEFQNKNLGHLNSLLFRKCTKNFDLKSPFVKLTLWILWMPSTIKLTCTSLWYTCYVVCFDGVRPDHMCEGVDLMNSLIDILCSCSPSPPMGKHICQHQGRKIYMVGYIEYQTSCFDTHALIYLYIFSCLCSSSYRLNLLFWVSVVWMFLVSKSCKVTLRLKVQTNKKLADLGEFSAVGLFIRLQKANKTYLWNSHVQNNISWKY